MNDIELALALLEIVAILLPLGLIALGMLPRWLDYDGEEILGFTRTTAIGTSAAYCLLFLSLSGVLLTIPLYQATGSLTIKSGIVVLMLVLAIFGIVGFGVSNAFENARGAEESEVYNSQRIRR